MSVYHLGLDPGSRVQQIEEAIRTVNGYINYLNTLSEREDSQVAEPGAHYGEVEGMRFGTPDSLPPLR